MWVWTIKELFRLTRSELLRLRFEILTELARLPKDSTEHGVALSSLDNIWRMLARRDPRPS